MSDTSPQIIPLGSLNEAALAGAELAQQEQIGAESAESNVPVLTGYIAP
jgi:hypothetical protein